MTARAAPPMPGAAPRRVRDSGQFRTLGLLAAVAALPMKLVPKLSLAFIAGVSLVLAANGYLRVRREVGLFESDRARDDALIGQSLASAAAAIWRTEGAGPALTMLQQSSPRAARVRVRWVWLDGSDAVPLDPSFLAARAPGEAVTRVGREGEEDRRYTLVRADVPGSRPGAVEVSESLAPERAYVRATIENTAVTMLTLDALCALTAMVLGAWIVGRPMGALAEKARRIGQGDFGAPLRMRQRDEIAALAQEMNSMCDRLVEANDRAARAMQDLKRYTEKN